ncbi:phosphoribosyltransferase [Pseudonocardia sp. HH130630-07]|uniref:phosphoribosyltransferase n=1 Tax=Pseudonocardia sp. HH130630-07 TaxID=1690815 RepID=UPI00081524F2|nr:phosphoribosyltransferase family protein [Pseudonocardia sp. HH130630-07]ANY07779.1 hypothetical protein AFB00_17415 [Pseudonocardia sp. HH130630-07]
MSAPQVALELDWAALHASVGTLAGRIRSDGTPDVVVGVLRGGAIPAVMLAHQLGVRSVRTVEITRTTSDLPHTAKIPPAVRDAAALGPLAGLDVLLVDDVVGSGATADMAEQIVRARGPARVRLAVAVINVDNWNRPDDPLHHFDYVGTTCAGWVRFPWEL